MHVNLVIKQEKKKMGKTQPNTSTSFCGRGSNRIRKPKIYKTDPDIGLKPRLKLTSKLTFEHMRMFASTAQQSLNKILLMIALRIKALSTAYRIGEDAYLFSLLLLKKMKTLINPHEAINEEQYVSIALILYAIEVFDAFNRLIHDQIFETFQWVQRKMIRNWIKRIKNLKVHINLYVIIKQRRKQQKICKIEIGILKKVAKEAVQQRKAHQKIEQKFFFYQFNQ